MPRYPFLGRGKRHPWSLRCQSYGLPQGLDTNTGHREAACSRGTGPRSAKPFTTLRPGLLRTQDIPDGQLGSRPGEGRSLSPCKLSQQGSCRPPLPRKEGHEEEDPRTQAAPASRSSVDCPLHGTMWDDRVAWGREGGS